MAHVIIERTEKEAEEKGWPCWMCLNNHPCIPDDHCRKCINVKVGTKPSEFYLKKYC